MGCGVRTESKSYTTAALGMIIGIVVLDQYFKHTAKTVLSQVNTKPVIPGFFHLTYVENTGAAFGILQGQSTLISIIVVAITLAVGYFLLSGKVKEPFLIFSIGLVLGGGIGNLLDRIQYGYVIDYLDFSALFGFPVFNLADICVVAGTFCIIIYVLLLEKKMKQKVQACEQARQELEGQEGQ